MLALRCLLCPHTIRGSCYSKAGGNTIGVEHREKQRAKFGSQTVPTPSPQANIPLSMTADANPLGVYLKSRALGCAPHLIFAYREPRAVLRTRLVAWLSDLTHGSSVS